MSAPNKRRKLSCNDIQSLHRGVSPPPNGSAPSAQKPSAISCNDQDPLHSYFRDGDKGQAPDHDHPLTLTISDTEDEKDINGEGFKKGLPAKSARTTTNPTASTGTATDDVRTWESPFRLTHITSLPASENVGTVRIEDVLGDVMLEEVWIFNYMHDIPWVMSKFDQDVVDSVKVTFMHGNWKTEDESRKLMEEQAKQWPKVTVKAAYMPEMYGTHHTKMMILFRRDELAQVIIHTANMIAFDWANMTQAAWISPLLPLSSTTKSTSNYQPSPSSIGESFKRDLLSYLTFYGRNRTGTLVDRLKLHSFSDIRAIFVSSVPGRHKLTDAKFGWPKLQKELSKIPSSSAPGITPKIMAQMSSIATLGGTDTWLSPVFFNALSKSASTPKAGNSGDGMDNKPNNPEFGIIFPSASEIRDSLNGYSSGSSIHIRMSSAAQQKSLSYLKPLLHHWSSSSSPSPSSSSASAYSAGRDRAAPHIKTYIRFCDRDDQVSGGIDWALLTSANLSTQAWGAAAKGGEVRVCSYEAGVLVHPGLWGEEVRMVPVFRKNEVGEKELGRREMVVIDDDDDDDDVDREDGGKVGVEVKVGGKGKRKASSQKVEEEKEKGKGKCADRDGGRDGKVKGVVALRMPYGLPVRRYERGEEIWVAGASYDEVDWMGMEWK